MLARRGCCNGGGLLLEQLLGLSANDLFTAKVSQWERCSNGAGASTSSPVLSPTACLLVPARRPFTTHNVLLEDAQSERLGCHQGLAALSPLTRSVPKGVSAPAIHRGLAAATTAAAIASPAAADSAQSPASASAVPKTATSDSSTQVPWPWVDPSRPNILPKDIVRRQKTPIPLDTALTRLLERLRPGQRSRHSLEVFVRFALDPRRSDHLVRGSVVLPYGTGKKIRLVVFAKGAEAEAARQEGVDLIGDEELINTIVSSEGAAIKFDKLIATPDFMRPLARAGKVLGPKGLMPNPKMGTLTNDVVNAIREIRRGRLDYRLGRDATIRAALGRTSMPVSQLEAHVGSLVASLLDNKPKGIAATAAAGSKGAPAGAALAPAAAATASMLDGYIRTFLLKTTHSAPVAISYDSLAAAVKQYRALVGGGAATDGDQQETAGEGQKAKAAAKAAAAVKAAAADVKTAGGEKAPAAAS